MEKTVDLSEKINNIFISGKICSGKSTIANQIAAKHPEYSIIDVGDIVREITRTSDRIQISSLDAEIIGLLRERLTSKTIVVGVRQISILSQIATSQDLCVWIEVDEQKLKERYLTRSAIKDSQLSFEEALRRDDVLGVSELKEYMKFQKNFEIIFN